MEVGSKSEVGVKTREEMRMGFQSRGPESGAGMLHTCLEGVEVGVGSEVEGRNGLEVVLGWRWDNLLGSAREDSNVGLRSRFRSSGSPGRRSGLYRYDSISVKSDKKR
jgi:hypothetical protein